MVGSYKKARKTYLRMEQSIQIFKLPLKAMRVDNPSSASQKTTLGDYTTPMTTPWLSAYQLQTSIPNEF